MAIPTDPVIKMTTATVKNALIRSCLFTLLTPLFLMLPINYAQAATYTVSSSQCDGPGSIVAAINQANSNPGTDTIEFASGLQVTTITTGGCGLPPNTFPKDLFLGIVTDDVVINGNGAQLIGAPRWVDASGSSNIVGACPSNPDLGASIVSQAPGFLRVEPGVSVTVNDLTALDLSAYIRMESGSTVDLNNVEARRINDWYMDCQRQAIEAPFGNVTLTITDSYFEQIQNAQLTVGSPDGTVFRGSNVVSGAGSLTVTGTRFESGLSAIQWSGNANIETSRFVNTGWINAYGPGTTNIVNSVFRGSSKLSGDINSVRASGGAIVNIKASSLSLLDSACPAACKSGFGALVATTGGAINLAESALGVGLTAGLGGSSGVILRTAGGTITADVSSWIQPTQLQPAADLKAITGQPLLLTDVPGLPTIADGALSFFTFPNALTPLFGTAGNPGVLIDVIADAGAGGANELISPIDGSTITVDALGNPRVDGNGRRNIGGVQLILAPYLNVVNTGDGTVDLSWSKPLDPNSGAISGYDLCYGSGTLPDPSLTTCVGGTVMTVNGPDTLSTQVNGLTNGTTYWFQVRGVNPAAGPWSNQVTAVPAGVPDAPVVSATPAAGSVQLSWTIPNEQGSALTGYVVEYRPAGTATWLLTSFTGLGNAFTVGGLIDLTSYEFSVIATNAIGSSTRGLVTATPRPAPYVAYANVTGFENNALTILPTFANVIGTPAYSLVSGSLPPGMTLSTTTGEITGTPTTAGSYPLTIQLVDSAFPTPVQSAFTVDIQPNASATLTANYDNYAGPAGSPLGSPLRPNVTGSTGALSFTLSGGDPLPSGLALNPTTGEISGTPDTATGRVFSLNMEITDSSGTINEPFNIEITPTLFYAASQGILGDALTVNPNTSAAATPGTYQLAAGQVLPAGLNLDSGTGSITGIPEVAGLSTVTIEYTTNLQTVSAQVPITINPYVIDLTYPPIAGEIGQAVTIQPSVTGLKGTATYSIDSGSLPAGLTLDPATGVISGTPTGSSTNGVVVIAVADLYEFGSSQALINLTAPTTSAPQSIPTLQSWALIALAFLMAGIGLRQVRRYGL